MRLTLDMPDVLHKKFASSCEKLGVSKNGKLRELIENFINGVGKEVNNPDESDPFSTDDLVDFYGVPEEEDAPKSKVIVPDKMYKIPDSDVLWPKNDVEFLVSQGKITWSEAIPVE